MPTQRNLNDLRARVSGQVLLPGDDGFEQARRPWNTAVDQRVAAVVDVADAKDVQAVVKYARSAGFSVTAQPNGHGASPYLQGVILLRTGALDAVRVDPAARTAWVGGGARWERVQQAASSFGLTGLMGSSPKVSVVGYTLGGGLSWFSRKFGWASDHVTAFEVVTADGEQRRVTADSDSDLFWALRGGGGDFAIVTGMGFGLHPVPELYGGRLLWPGVLAPQVLEAFGQITAEAPDELSVWATIVHPPGDAPSVAVIDFTYLGLGGSAADLLAPLDDLGMIRFDTRRTMSPAELPEITNDPTEPSPGVARTELLTGLDPTAIKVVTQSDINPLMVVSLRHLGGALARPSDTPQGALAEPYALTMSGPAPSSPATQRIRARQRQIFGDLGALVSGRKPFTFLATDESAASAFTPQAARRLGGLKVFHDPDMVIRSNFPVLG